MTYQVFQHWDPLCVCVVGRCYPPEFFSWIKHRRIRNLFEQIAIETEEDLQLIIKKLESFGVTILRPEIFEIPMINGAAPRPPITPRDHMVMVGSTFYESWSSNFDAQNYQNIKDPEWPECSSWLEFNRLPDEIQKECKTQFNFGNSQTHRNEYDKIIDLINNQGNIVKSGYVSINGSMLARIGKDLFFGTECYQQDLEKTKSQSIRSLLIQEIM